MRDDRQPPKNVEVFFVDEELANDRDTYFWNQDDNESYGSGWYFWFCFPGCLPESDPHGPYADSDEAIAASHGFFDDTYGRVLDTAAPSGLLPRRYFNPWLNEEECDD